MVSVPVLSVQMTVALPSVSTAGSLRMRTWRAAIRWTPIASAMVTIAGSPSGTAATASDTADMNTSSGGRPRTNPSTAVTATIPRHRISSVWLTRASRVCSGVVVSVALAEQVRDPPELGLHARREHLGAPRPCRDRRAHEDAVEPLGQRRVRGRGRRALLDRRALAGQGRLVRRQQMRFDEARVGGDDVARFEHQQIARDHSRGGDLDAMAVADHAGARRRHRSQRQQRVLGAAFLEEADQRVQHDDRRDRDGVGDLTEESRHRRGGEQQPDERARELPREEPPAGRSLRALDLVGADLGQAALRLLGREAGRL